MRKLSDVQAKIGEMMGEVRARKAKRPRTSEFFVSWMEGKTPRTRMFYASKEGGAEEAEDRANRYARTMRATAGSAEVEVWWRPNTREEYERVG